MKMIDNIPIWGSPVDTGALSQIKMCLETADRVALMADHHKGYSCPIGGVVAYKNAISPSCVGYDIACGNKAVKLEVDPRYVIDNISTFMDSIQSTISFGIGQKNNTRVEHELFDDELWSSNILKPLKEMARNQLGTVGSGNHFVDVFLGDDNHIWVGVHFGSRGLGHKIATYFLNAGGAENGMDSPPLVLDVNSDLGEAYIEHMTLAGRYAYAGRDWACAAVANILGGVIIDEVHNHHNYAWEETLPNNETYWVVRKGATPAYPSQRGFIGSSMGESSVIIKGLENKFGLASMYSTVHGAGRVMGRMEAKGKVNRKTGEIKRKGKISRDMMNNWLRSAKVELRGGDVDESPDCYKRLTDVLNEHKGMIEVERVLRPIGVCMAGAGEFDPYKD